MSYVESFELDPLVDEIILISSLPYYSQTFNRRTLRNTTFFAFLLRRRHDSLRVSAV